ncbi:peptidase M3, partial [Enterococcus faecalis]|nr:peptidase M3 [Enterococcus faecalis]
LAKYIKKNPGSFNQLTAVSEIGSQHSDEKIISNFLNVDLENFIQDIKRNWRNYCQ